MSDKCKDCEWLSREEKGVDLLRLIADDHYIVLHICAYFTPPIYKAKEDEACDEFKKLI